MTVSSVRGVHQTTIANANGPAKRNGRANMHWIALFNIQYSQQSQVTGQATTTAQAWAKSCAISPGADGQDPA